ncbi:uncharacterized protein LOC113855533 [Abrus precatorius]|uniref:Uncharacterized protein LOC113855533 n=1 Tax=Abrus precatorius TaxID=3816 RepID=A0A8B8KGN1_ABRPR|nr:uncharacterized protein LOC113855533 [Abrus precatorius]
MAREIVVSFISKIAKCIIGPIGHQFGYTVFHNSNLKGLKTDVQKLEGTKDSVQHSADEAKRNGEEIEKIVQHWLHKADGTIAEAKKLIDFEGHANVGYFPNIWTRHQLSRKRKRMTRDL